MNDLGKYHGSLIVFGLGFVALVVAANLTLSSCPNVQCPQSTINVIAVFGGAGFVASVGSFLALVHYHKKITASKAERPV